MSTQKGFGIKWSCWEQDKVQKWWNGDGVVPLANQRNNLNSNHPPTEARRSEDLSSLFTSQTRITASSFVFFFIYKCVILWINGLVTRDKEERMNTRQMVNCLACRNRWLVHPPLTSSILLHGKIFIGLPQNVALIILFLCMVALGLITSKYKVPYAFICTD